MAALLGAAGPRSSGGLNNLSTFKRWLSIMLLLDDGGISERCSSKLFKGNVTGSSKAARDDVTAVSDALQYKEVLTAGLAAELQPSLDHVMATINTADNVDFVRDHRAVSCLGIGVTMVGVLSKGDVAKLEVVKDKLQSLSDSAVAATSMTKHDKALVEDEANLRTLCALQLAADAMQGRETMADAATERAQLHIGDRVQFTAGGRRKQGTVESLDDKGGCTVQFTHGDGSDDRRTGSTKDFEKLRDEEEEVQAPPAPPAKRPRGDAEERKARIEQDVNLGRTRGRPCPTFAHDIVYGVSSKHWQSAHQAYVAMRKAQGLPVMFAIVDFEFFVALANERFLQGAPLIVFPAFGHLLKAHAVSSMAFDKLLWTRRLMIALAHLLEAW